MTDEQTIETASETETVEQGPESIEPADTGIDLSRVRDLVLAAHPDVVPEMVRGETFDELMASIDPAREAHQRIVDEQRRAQPAPKVAAQPGQRSASLADVESLSPLGKISEGLRRQR